MKKTPRVGVKEFTTDQIRGCHTFSTPTPTLVQRATYLFGYENGR